MVQGYPKGEWKPGRRTDTGKGIKKPGRKKKNGHTSADIKLEVGHIVNYMTFGKSKIEHKNNIADKVKKNVPLTVDQACREYGIAPVTFRKHLGDHPEAKALYKELKVNRREYMKELSEGFITEGLSGKTSISDKERMDFSFKLLEKTDKAYQPKMEIESKSIGINLNKSTDDILAELQTILGQ